MKMQTTLPPIEMMATVENPAEIPWGVDKINAPKMWDEAQGEGVVVAVLDTGCDTTHSDLKGRIVGGRNFTTDYNGDAENYQDNQGHGTHCAGVIAGNLNANGVVGVAPKAKLLIGKVLCGDGTGDFDSVIKAINWAKDWRGENGERVQIISMSLGGPQKVSSLHNAIKQAIAEGIAFVVASGNNGDGKENTDELSYPGAYEEVIEVGATNAKDEIANFSNTNDFVDVVAPGVDIVSIMPNEKWAKMSGTSMATPHVAGTLALLISKYQKPNEKLTEAEIYELLLNHVRKLNTSKKASGNGIVDLSEQKTEKVEEEIPKDEEKTTATIEIQEKDGKYYVVTGPFDKETVKNITAITK